MALKRELRSFNDKGEGAKVIPDDDDGDCCTSSTKMSFMSFNIIKTAPTNDPIRNLIMLLLITGMVLVALRFVKIDVIFDYGKKS